MKYLIKYRHSGKLIRALLILLILGVSLATRAATHIITYRLTQAGRVSLNVYDAKGIVVRELLRARLQPAGEHTVMWDGLDRDGKCMPAGAYTWKLLQTQGLSSHYLLSLGSNYPIGADWRNACGPGTHGTPFGVAVDDTGIYISANTTENIETCSLKLSPDGNKRLWNNLHPNAWDGAQSLAVDRGELFMLGKVDPQKLYVYHAQTGAMGRGLDVRWEATSKEIVANDMDICDGVLVVTYPGKNTIRWYNPVTGALLDSAEVSAPQGVTVGHDGAVFLTTGAKVVKLTQADHTLRDVVTGLVSPGRLDVDHTSGDLLIYQGGASQQIVRVSAAGVLLKMYGVAGGRPQGLYTAETKKSFNGFGDLCADGAGGFFITESNSAPRRVAHLNAAGEVLREWYGGQRWAPHAAPEPDNPNVVWVGSQYGWIMRVIVDYAKKTWTVHSCYQYPGLADGLVGDSWNEGCYFKVYKHNGSTYLALEKATAILKVDEDTWRLLPVTVCGNVGNATPRIKEWAAGKASFQWNDANGDGLPQQAEVTYYNDGMVGSVQPTVDANFTVFLPADKVRTYPVTGWNAAGAPIYGSVPGGEEYADFPERFGGGFYHDPRWSGFLYHDIASGRLYGALNNGTTGWCSSVDSVMQSWGANKALAWGVSEQGPGVGQIFYNLRGIAGVTHGCVVAIDVDGGWNMANLARSYVWDAEGLFVGGIMDHPDLNGIPDFMYQGSGEYCHSALYNFPNGEVYFYANWENEVRVYRVSGWEQWVRQSGTLKVTTPSTAHQGQGLLAEFFTKPTFDGKKTMRVDGMFTAKSASARWCGMVQPTYGPAYSGGWAYWGDAAAFEGGMHACRDMHCRMSWAFNGVSVSLIGRTGPNYGYAKIYLDGVLQQQVDYYSPAITPNVTLFTKAGLPAGDHLLEVEVVGWLAPRNPKSTDAWVTVDKLVVGEVNLDDNGAPYTFTTGTDGRVQVWLNGESIIYDWQPKTTPSMRSSAPVKLLRVPYALQVSYLKGAGAGVLSLGWADPFTTLHVIPVSAFYPTTLSEPYPALESASVFVTRDTTTKGNWKGVFGRDGYLLPYGHPGTPAYANVTVHDMWRYTWGTSPDERALLNSTDIARTTGCWGSNTSFTFDITLTDGQWRQVALYAVDWDKQGRQMKVEILDPSGTQVLDTQETGAYIDGQYLVWRLKGHVKMRVTRVAGPNALVMGLFFAPLPG